MLIAKDTVFSDKENRKLASMPGLSFASVIDGSYMEKLEKYLTDQFPVRNTCVSVKTAALRMTGEKKINGVYLADNGYLIAQQADSNDDALDRLITSINIFDSRLKNIDVNVMIVPNAVSIYENLLPFGAESDQKEILDHIHATVSENIDFIDVYDILKDNKVDGMFYKTDHHWTTRAAYLAFWQYASMNSIDLKGHEFKFYTLTGKFQGTQASECGVYSSYDDVEMCVPEGAEGSYVVNYIEEIKKTTTLFNKEKLSEKDKYQVFMGGNYSQVNINTTAGTGRNLLILKDSYANCFIPMLTPFYDKIVVVDPRYFYNNIYDVIDENKINEVLFLYNLNSFEEDNSLEDVLMNMGEE